MIKFIAACAAAMVVSAAAAQAPQIKIDFTQKLSSVGGKPLLENGDDCKPGQVGGRDCSQVQMTLSDAAVGALEAPLPDDGTDAMKKFARDQLARKVYENSAAELSPDELAMLKDRIGKAWNAPQVGAVWPLLDGTLPK